MMSTGAGSPVQIAKAFALWPSDMPGSMVERPPAALASFRERVSEGRNTMSYTAQKRVVASIGCLKLADTRWLYAGSAGVQSSKSEQQNRGAREFGPRLRTGPAQIPLHSKRVSRSPLFAWKQKRRGPKAALVLPVSPLSATD